MKDNVSTKICRIIHSYTDYVNRLIWKKILTYESFVIGHHFWPENFKVNDLIDGLLDRGHDVKI